MGGWGDVKMLEIVVTWLMLQHFATYPPTPPKAAMIKPKAPTTSAM